MVLLSALFILTYAKQVDACPVCFGGDPDSDQVRGAFWGVVVLGVIVYGVLMGMVGIGVTWFVRAKALQN